MINILIEGMTCYKGGKETYIINIFQAIDKQKYHITFVAYDQEIAYEEMVKKEGAEVIHIPARSKGPIRHRKALDRLMKEKKYDVVWAHKTTLSACELLSASKKYQVPVRIIHSHSSSNMGGKFTYFMHSINKKRIFGIANEYWACSQTAAKWFYGSHEAQIMVNGIDLEKYKYDESVRNRLRKQLNIEEDFVIGHVGRFGIEKNHKKLLNVFKACKDKKENVKLILCGDGEERKNIENQIQELGIQEDVIILGVIDNVNEMLQAMDIMVMPSLFEGLPFALLEAQAAGLKCIVSDTVSVESDIMGWNKFLSLNVESEVWAKVILNENTSYERNVGYIQMKEREFDIGDIVRKIEEIIDSRLYSLGENKRWP